jgi:hypothetical protein
VVECGALERRCASIGAPGVRISPLRSKARARGRPQHSFGATGASCARAIDFSSTVGFEAVSAAVGAADEQSAFARGCLVRVAHYDMSVTGDLTCVVGRNATSSELVDRSLGHEQFGDRVGHATGLSNGHVIVPRRPVAHTNSRTPTSQSLPSLAGIARPTVAYAKPGCLWGAKPGSTPSLPRLTLIRS